MVTYDVKPEIEAFDLSHILKAAEMHKKGQIKDTPYVQFVMGVKNAMPADRDVFDFYVKTVDRLFPGAPWCAAGIGAQQEVLNPLGNFVWRPCTNRPRRQRTPGSQYAGTIKCSACNAHCRDL